VAKPLIKERYQYTPEATKKDISQQSRLTDYKYPKMELRLPKKYQKEVLYKAHNSIFGGHDATLKTYIKITSSYYWPGIYQDIKTHVQTCLTCQQRK
jgi:hypothetical protein